MSRFLFRSPNKDIWSRAAHEMPDGAYGGYEGKYKYRIYLVLHEQCTVEDEAGATALRCLARLEKKMKSDIKLKYPLEGFENNFRADIASALKLRESDAILGSPVFFAVLPKSLDEFHPDVHRFAVIDIGPFLTSNGNLNAIAFGQSISKIASMMGESENFFEELERSAAEQKPKEKWADIIDVKPRLGWIVFDLKKLGNILYKRKV